MATVSYDTRELIDKAEAIYSKLSPENQRWARPNLDAATFLSRWWKLHALCMWIVTWERYVPKDVQS